MKCNEVKELLMPFHDGELEPAVAAEVEKALVGCADCQTELSELATISGMARVAFTETTPEADLSGVFDAVMARIALEERESAAETAGAAAIEGVRVQRQATQPSVWERLSAWFGELVRLERPFAAMGVAAAVLALVAGVWFTGGAQGPDESPAHVIAVDEGPDGLGPEPRPRRGREGEVAVRSAVVEQSIAEVGEIKIIELDNDEEDRALVLWHVVEGEGVQLPDNGVQ
jgi:hypothetical protein